MKRVGRLEPSGTVQSVKRSSVIEEFLPPQLTEEESTKAVDDRDREVGATHSIRDMGKVTALLNGYTRDNWILARLGPKVKRALYLTLNGQ